MKMDFVCCGEELEVAAVGRSGSRMLVFRPVVVDNSDINVVDGARIMLIGGDATYESLRRIVEGNGRSGFSDLIPGGIASSPHTLLRRYVGL